ncbi:hypothetical protein TRFO_35316 [Tritrichomonas foetus]|uniref:Kinetochore protein SPC25 n=1 Tax=Tritrichomonas foetus TaxID=1144522 RepID=A0A1J4JIV5_9EUKA|nr:hypothetical protein TRFO_35316 [Tritrichomonas foetus]|eukprot:OHS98287.1 hypothetical protein TRFO_35316 [Tritrichomonas foetus]
MVNYLEIFFISHFGSDVRLIKMNDEIKANVDQLMKLLEEKQQEFDHWLDTQMRNLQNYVQNQKEITKKYESNVNKLKDQQSSIKQGIQKAQNDVKQCQIKEKQMNNQKDQLEREIQTIPKDFDFYKYNILILETKANRLKSSNAQNIESIHRMKSTLEAYETLFGVSFHIEKGITTIEFMEPKATIKMSCEKETPYHFIEVPKELNPHQKQIMGKFNVDKNLFNLLSSIRSNL